MEYPPGFNPGAAAVLLTTAITWTVNPVTGRVIVSGTDADGTVWTAQLAAEIRNDK